MGDQDASLTVSINAETGSTQSEIEKLGASLNGIAEANAKVGSVAEESGNKQVAVLRTVSASQMQVLNDLKARFADEEKLIAQVTGVAVDAEAQKAKAAKAAAAEITAAHREEQKASQESAFVLMDIGYALQAVGLQGSRVLGDMGYLMRDVTSVSGGTLVAMLALAGGISVIVTAFAFLADSAKAVQKWDEDLSLLGNIVRDQGGNWDKLKGEVLAYAEVQEKTTNYSRDEVVNSLRELTRAGIDLGDAMKINRVAEDAAAATGKPLIDITHALMEATHGHTRALAELGIGTKQSIKDGMSFNDVLAAIERQMGGEAAAAADAYGGKLTSLHNDFETLQQKVGEDLIPVLDHMIDSTKHIVEVAESELPKAEKAWDGLQKGISGVVNFLKDQKPELEIAAITGSLLAMRAALDTLAATTLPAFGAAMGQAFLAARVAVSGFMVSIGPVGWTILAIGAVGTAFAEAWTHNWLDIKEKTGDAINSLVHWLGDLLTSLGQVESKIGNFLANVFKVNPIVSNFYSNVGNGLLSAGKSLHNFHVDFSDGPQVSDESDFTPGVRKNPVDTRTGVTTEIGGGAHKSVGSSVAQTADQVAKEKAIDAVIAAQDKLKTSLASLTAQESAYKLMVELASTADEKAAAERAYKTKISEDAYAAGALIDQQINAEQNEISKLTAERQKEKTALEAAKSALDAYVQSLPLNAEGEHVRQTKAQNAEYAFLSRAVKDANSAYNATDSTLKTLNTQLTENNRLLVEHAQHVADDAREAAAAAVKADEAAKKRAEELVARKQQMADEIATYKASIGQQIAYYTQRLALEQAAHGQDTDEARKLQDEIYKLDFEGYKQRIDAYDAFIKSWQTKEVSWLDDIIGKHKSLRDSLKTVWDGIVSDIEKSFEQMIVKSALFNGLNKGIAGIFGMQGLGAGGIGAAAGLFAAGIPAIASGATAGAPIGSAGNPAVVKHSPEDLAALTGSARGLNVGSGDGSGLPVIPGSSIQNSASATWEGGSTSTGSSGKSSVLGTSLKNFGLGAAANSMLGGNAANSAIGDTLGSIAALVTNANPIAGAALAVGGSILGGLIGPHETAAETPDISQSGYQQWMANYTGVTQTSNGVPTFAAAANDTTIGNQSVSSGIESWLNNPANLVNLPAGMQQAIAALKQYQGSDTANGLDAIPSSLHQGNITLASGQIVPVAQLESYINTAQNYMGTSSTTPVYSLTRTYPSGVSTIGPQDGAVTTNSTTGGTVYTPTSGASPSTSALRTTGQGITVNIDLSGSVGTPTPAVVAALMPALRDALSGYMPGGYAQTITNTQGGN